MEDNNNWDDSKDEIFNILDTVVNEVSFEVPLICPVCKEQSAHLYMRHWNEAKGTIWVWCSSCKVCAHGSFKLPKWWENDDFMDTSELTSHPIYLNRKVELVDEHLRKLLYKRRNKY